jgi:hypothetical protein
MNLRRHLQEHHGKPANAAAIMVLSAISFDSGQLTVPGASSMFPTTKDCPAVVLLLHERSQVAWLSGGMPDVGFQASDIPTPLLQPC